MDGKGKKQAKYGMVECSRCGMEFGKRRVDQTYCSAKCRWEAWDEGHPRVGVNVSGEGICEECGKEFSRVKGQRYCTPGCRFDAWLRRKAKERGVVAR